MSSEEELVTDETDRNDPDIQQIMREVFGNVIGASVSEPLSGDLNVNFVCLSASLSVMDHQIPSFTSGSYFARSASYVNSKTTQDMNHGQSNSAMATTRTETTHGLTYSRARAIDITTWQSVDAICLCCLTHGACVKVTGLQPLLTTARMRLTVVHGKEDS